MNLESFPVDIKEDIEDQSLELLEGIKDNLLVIGGWAVRGLVGEKHKRYTLDIDAVGSENTRRQVEAKLMARGMQPKKADWGIQYFKHYDPTVEVPDNVDISEVELRIEVSGPRITEFTTPHFFEFDMKDYVTRTIPFHNRDEGVQIKVPPKEQMAAVKMGLPVDYKNNFDSVMLLQLCKVPDVLEVILSNDNWSEMVLRRLPKLKGRIKDRNGIAYLLATNEGINIRDHVRKLEEIESSLRSL